jgi:hypothetical protein
MQTLKLAKGNDKEALTSRKELNLTKLMPPLLLLI